MPTEPMKPKSKRANAERLFPRGERGVVCYRVDLPALSMRRGGKVREDRHVAKRELAEIANGRD